MQTNAASKRKGAAIVAVSFLLMAVLYPPAVTLPGLFVTDMAETFGATRTAITFMTTLAILSSMAGAVVFGRLYNRYPIRRFMPVLLAISAAGYLGNVYASSLLQVYILAVIRGFFGAGLTTLPISIAISNWYPQSMRGRAVGIAMVGSGVGAMVLSPIVGHIIATAGWRMGYLLFAVLTAVMLLPVMLFFTPSPADVGLAPVGGEQAPGAVAAVHGPGAVAAIKTPVFWMAVLAMLLLAGTSQSWNNNGAAYLGDIGLPTTQLSAILSVTSFGLIVGKLALGAISDRFGIRAGVVCGGVLLSGAYLLWIASARFLWLVPAAAVVKGLGMSVITIAPPLLVGHLFGSRDYSVFIGYFQIATALGSGVMPLAVSLLYDVTGSYIPAWWAVCGIAVLAILFAQVAFARRQQV